MKSQQPSPRVRAEIRVAAGQETWLTKCVMPYFVWVSRATVLYCAATSGGLIIFNPHPPTRGLVTSFMDLVPESEIQQVWDGLPQSVFLTSVQVLLMLLFQGPQSENCWTTVDMPIDGTWPTRQSVRLIAACDCYYLLNHQSS